MSDIKYMKFHMRMYEGVVVDEKMWIAISL